MFDNWYNVDKRPTHGHHGAVITAQVDWELQELIKVFDHLAPTRVLEIGSQWGGTLWYWLEGVPAGARVANIDILQNMAKEDADALPGKWKSWAPAGVELRTFLGRSDDTDIIAQVEHFLPEIDFLFIDALHTYEGAKHDFTTYGKLVRKGGIIALHDIITPQFSPHIQVWQLWREIQAAGYLTRELRAGANYGGIGVIYV